MGTFYRSPSPEASPCVEVGQTVNPSDVVCVIESMKIFTELRAAQAGTVKRILVEDEGLVMKKQELIEIEIADGEDSEEIRDAMTDWDSMRRECGREHIPRTLMDLATIAGRVYRKNGKVQDWDISEEINACTLKVNARINGKDEPWLLSFKNETHNHPTEIEPYGGASTCLGGAIRDPLSGRAYVHQALRVSGGADPRQDPSKARQGKLPQRIIAHGAAEGYAGYGNQIGLATAVVREFYHPGYEAKRLECGAVMGASPAGHVIREVPEKGDVVLLVGGRTGRDGIGGATGSSVAHDGLSLDKAGAEVQKGNPPEERKLQRLFRNPRAAGLIRRCNDFGAGGIAVAVGELADGLFINLDNVPIKYDGLDGLELALSESQERMAVVVRASDADKFISLAAAENLEAVSVAVISEGRRLKMVWKGVEVINLSRDLLDTNGVRRTAAALVESDDQSKATNTLENSVLNTESLKKILSSTDFASRRGLEQRFDGTVGGGTVLASHGGKHQMTPAEASIHLLPADGVVETAGIMTVGFDPDLASRSPFRGGQFALIESLAKCVAAGGSWRKTRFSLQEYFGRTDKGAEAWGRPLSALLGALTVQRYWDLPAIGGKDSMSGSFDELDVPPTIIAFAASAMDAANAVGAAIPDTGLTLALVGASTSNSGKPDFDSLSAAWDWIESLRAEHRIKAAASVGKGGWAGKLVLMSLGNRIGVSLSENVPIPPFVSNYGSVIVATDLTSEELSAAAGDSEVVVDILGKSIPDARLQVGNSGIELSELEDSWRRPFAEVWPEDRSGDTGAKTIVSSDSSLHRSTKRTKRQTTAGSKPRVCIPVFPGTNGEDDARRAFARAGAQPGEHIFLDRTAEGLESALTSLASSIENSQILYISGGFSAGDEPDGAGKYIAAILRQPRVAEAIAGLLERDGLILGICNGFQALLKSGWLENGVAGIPSADSPTLTHNRIGRHVARIITTVASGVSSPWLSKISRGDVHSIPVSHGEGRFTAPASVLGTLAESDRIPFQYCDSVGLPNMGGEWNPNGSDMAIEAMLSPCGRILGKMGHSERWRERTLVDIPGMELEQPLIPGGVEWFK